MANQGQLRGTTDTSPVISFSTGPGRIAFNGEFGADGEISIEEQINGRWVPHIDDGTTTPITSNSSLPHTFYSGDVIRFQLTLGDSTTLIDYKVTSG